MPLSYLPTLNWPIYSGWSAFTPTIPKMYWDVYSQEQTIKELCCNYSKLQQYMDYIAKLTNDWVKEFTDASDEELDNFMKLIESGYKDALDKWIARDLPDIVKAAIKMVYFGLNSDGYFVAYIPDSWKEINFDTGAIYGRSDYGRLKLRYNVEGIPDNTYSYNVAQLTSDEEFVNDFEALNNVVSQWRDEFAALEQRVENLEG